MAYTVRISTRFKKDFKRCMKRGLDMKLITDAMDLLEATGTLPAEYNRPSSFLHQTSDISVAAVPVP